MFKGLCRSDKAYIARLKQHYQMIKAEAGKRDLVRYVRNQYVQRQRASIEKPEIVTKRNDQCSCGSGKNIRNVVLISAA